MAKEREMEDDLKKDECSHCTAQDAKTINHNIYENLKDVELSDIDVDFSIEENYGYVVFDGKSIPKDKAKDKDTTHYAEIVKGTPRNVEKTVQRRRQTRESDHPILQLSSDYKERQLEDCDEGLVMADDVSVTVSDEYAESLTSNGENCSVSRLDSELVYKDIHSEVLYTNTHETEVLYENASVLTEHIYENVECEKKKKQREKSITSNCSFDTESLYEHIDIYESMTSPRRRFASEPIDIVKSSVNLNSSVSSESPRSLESYSNSGSLTSYGSFERPDLRRCTSYCYGNAPFGVGRPPELPHRDSVNFTKKCRPRSFYLGNEEGYQADNQGLGCYTGTLVGSGIVKKTSPKSVQKIIGDYLSREKKDFSKPVSLQITNEFICLSYNCAPWWLLAKNSLDDIGCITTYNNNSKTALGYTISKPGEDTRLFVVHCSDADQIKDVIVKNFRQPYAPNSISRWGSLNVLSTPRSGNSRSLPRIRSMQIPQANEIASYDDILYLGCQKVRKSFLVVNDNISFVMDGTQSKDYTTARIELYRDGIHLKHSQQDRVMDIHKLEWILSMGLFDEDRRYFGYISSKAFQGKKISTSCHVFRCNRVELASQIMETIRKACQATYLARTSPPKFRFRAYSGGSTSSEGSVCSNSETSSLGSNSSTSPEAERSQTLPARFRKRPGRSISKRMSNNRMSTIQSFGEDDNDTGFDTIGDESSYVSEDSSCSRESWYGGLPQIPDNVLKSREKTYMVKEEEPTQITSTQSEETLIPSDLSSIDSLSLTRSVAGESSSIDTTLERTFSVQYLISTIVSSPLKSKHVKECLKQYQKSIDKATKKSADHTRHNKKAQLIISPRGVTIVDDKIRTSQAFYEHSLISGVQTHPNAKCAFAFTTVVSGSSKQKCHLFLEDSEPINVIVEEIKKFTSR